MNYRMSKVIIKKLDEQKFCELGIVAWPIWEKEKSRFDWTYDDNEQCYIIEGEFIVETDEGSFSVGLGDFVFFEKGLSCVWDIKIPVKKYYKFS